MCNKYLIFWQIISPLTFEQKYAKFLTELAELPKNKEREEDPTLPPQKKGSATNNPLGPLNNPVKQGQVYVVDLKIRFPNLSYDRRQEPLSGIVCQGFCSNFPKITSSFEEQISRKLIPSDPIYVRSAVLNV